MYVSYIFVFKKLTFIQGKAKEKFKEKRWLLEIYFCCRITGFNANLVELFTLKIS